MPITKDSHLIMRDIRISKGISQKFVSEKLGYKSSAAYANIEYGNTKLTLETAVKVADILGCSIEDFLQIKVKQKV